MGTFLCNECGKNFAMEADLYIHQSRTHDLNSYTCEKCSENFVGKDTLYNHMRKHNSAVSKLNLLYFLLCLIETFMKVNARGSENPRSPLVSTF